MLLDLLDKEHKGNERLRDHIEFLKQDQYKSIDKRE